MSLYNSNISSDEAGLTISLLESITDAYNRNDLDAVMLFFDEDAVFDHAAGALPINTMYNPSHKAHLPVISSFKSSM